MHPFAHCEYGNIRSVFRMQVGREEDFLGVPVVGTRNIARLKEERFKGKPYVSVSPYWEPWVARSPRPYIPMLQVLAAPVWLHLIKLAE